MSALDVLPPAKRVKTDVAYSPLRDLLFGVSTLPDLRDLVMQYYDPHYTCKKYLKSIGYGCIHPSKTFQSKYPWTWSHHYPGHQNRAHTIGYLYVSTKDAMGLTLELMHHLALHQ